MSPPESNHGAWLAKAEGDFLNIENNLRAARAPYDTLCFHAQQAAEKLLKAFLVFHGGLPARTHDLVALLSECVSRDSAMASLEEDCRRLTYYAVMARYPTDLDEPDETEARSMLSAARRVEAAVRSRLAKP